MPGLLYKADAQLLRAMRAAVIAMMTALVVVVFLQISARYVLSLSLVWSEEAARLLFICTVFVGAAILVREREHLTVTVFIDLVPRRAQYVAEVLASLVGLWCSYYLVSGAAATLMGEWRQLTPALRVPMGLIYAIVLGSTVLMFLWLLVNLLNSVRCVMTGVDHRPKGLSPMVSAGNDDVPAGNDDGSNGSKKESDP